MESMHRDRLRWLIKKDKLDTLDGVIKLVGAASKLLDQLDSLTAALQATEFGFNHTRCPYCAGWDGTGENDYIHAKECIVKAALDKAAQR
jgi:hypothetical protein